MTERPSLFRVVIDKLNPMHASYRSDYTLFRIHENPHGSLHASSAPTTHPEPLRLATRFVTKLHICLVWYLPAQNRTAHMCIAL